MYVLYCGGGGGGAAQRMRRRRLVGASVYQGAVTRPCYVGARRRQNGFAVGTGARLDELLRAAVQQANVRVAAVHVLALELQHQPQHTVCGGVLRAKVQREVLHLGALEKLLRLQRCEREAAR